MSDAVDEVKVNATQIVEDVTAAATEAADKVYQVSS